MLTKSWLPLTAILALLQLPAVSEEPRDPQEDSDPVARTSSGNFVLVPPSKLAGEGALKGAERVSQLALSAAVADAAALKKEQAVLQDEVSEYEAVRAAAQAEWDKVRSDYDYELQKYTARNEAQAARVESHVADVMEQRAQAEASNALPADQRNAANVDRLNRWAEQINARKAALDKESASLVAQYNALKAREEAALRFQRDTDARLKAMYDALVARFEDLSIREGSAYRQLKQCYDYAVEIRGILQDKHRVETSRIPRRTWFEAEEAIKELSNKGFDGNAGKPPLR